MTNRADSHPGVGSAFGVLRLAVAAGFEPAEAFTSRAFEARSLGRSDTPPPGRLPKSGGLARIESSSAAQPVHLGRMFPVKVHGIIR